MHTIKEMIEHLIYEDEIEKGKNREEAIRELNRKLSNEEYTRYMGEDK
jgi:hypothetical protein